MLTLLLAAIAAGTMAPKTECDRLAITRYVTALRTAQGEHKESNLGEESARRFFRAMPDSFGCFNEVFGYPREAPGPLYDEPQRHFLFPQMAVAVPRQAFALKLVRLSVGARWEADQTGALQHAVRTVLDETPVVFVGELKKLDATAEYSVWRFLFGASHPSNELLTPELKKQLCSLSQRSCELHAKAYAAALAVEEHH